ncbi:uncharacterized protein LOC115327317 [Ixodes scapularis]|uniref:uncharacterized protein LOC115327317 n=1 Tax=Ixodes scapularis TaxID=6945 RepID=UPI001A9D84E6|nr:uncharacterized protein LOC115327317 [Ixodes scapularis]
MLPSWQPFSILWRNPQGRPYRTQDFAEALEGTVGMKHVVGLGAFQFNHVWICTLDSADAKEGLVALKEVTVKGKKCVVIDPNVKEAVVRVNWLPTYVTDGEVCAAFAEYGNVTRITREKWKSPSGTYEVETSARAVTITMKEGTAKDELPHQGKVAGYPVLISVPGRPPMCLRCSKLGHMRKQCRAPWCRHCRGYGHLESECVPTNAAKTRRHADTLQNSDLLDDGEVGESEPAANSMEAVTPAEGGNEEEAGPEGKDKVTDVASTSKNATSLPQVPAKVDNPKASNTVKQGKRARGSNDSNNESASERQASPSDMPADAAAPVRSSQTSEEEVAKGTTKVTRHKSRTRKNEQAAIPALRPRAVNV